MKDSKVLLRCHAGCSIDAVCAAAGLTTKDLFLSELPKTSERKRIAATYDYRDESGDLLYQSIRYEPKSFRYRRPNGAGGYEWNLAETRLVLYRLPELLGADPLFPVFIVEGEKDVDALRSIGVTATCNPMGALKWKDAFSGSLKGFDCVVLPDNDESGRRHAQRVAKSLFGKADRVRVLQLPGLPEKGDVSDWLVAGNTREDLFALLMDAAVFEGEANGADASIPELPDRFFLTDTGLYYRDKDDIFVSSPIRVTARTCDRENGNWGRRVEFSDAKGVEHSLIVPMNTLSGDAAEVRRILMDAGLMIAAGAKARQLFLDYLLRSDPSLHVTCVMQLGWHDGAFVFPDAVISKNDSRRKQYDCRVLIERRTSSALPAHWMSGGSRLQTTVSGILG